MRTYIYIMAGLAVIAAVVTGFVLYNAQNTSSITGIEEGREIEKMNTNPENATYVIDGEPRALVDGLYESIGDAGASSGVRVMYFGNELAIDLNNDGREDNVFLLTEERGGSGTYFYVVAALDTGDGFEGSEALFIGDRIAPQTIERGQNGTVVVNYADRAPGEPFTASPSVGKSLVLKFDRVAKQFGEVAQDFEGEADPARMSLTMKTWEWVSAIDRNGQTIVPKKQGVYTLTFIEADKRVSVGTDCNGMGGEYSASSGGSLTFDAFMSTMMYCEGSEEGVFASLLQETASYEFTGRGELVLHSADDVVEVRLR